LIEIMIVVAIIGLVAAMGLPSMIMALHKEGLRKAVSDLQDICSAARSQAIFRNQKMAVVFHPATKRFEVEGAAASGSADSTDKSSGKVTGSTLPDSVDMAMLDINLQDYGASDWARVFFYPNGTSDEMTVVLHSKDEWRKITLEFSTGLTSVSDVNK
jgi:Tfp pilus assembly protein FimT